MTRFGFSIPFDSLYRRMFREIIKWLMVRSKMDFHLNTPDRTVLEKKILPWLAAQPSMGRVLFIGCAWYTYAYRRWFPPATYWTLDANPKKKPFGSPQHIVDSLTNLRDHFAPHSLDLIICNGVLGWGLDAPCDIEAAFYAVHTCLRPGGLLLLGWNDVPKHRPVPLEDIAALRSFLPQTIEPLGVSQFLTASRNRHIYTLLRKS